MFFRGHALLATLGALSPQSIAQLVLSGEVVSEQVASLLALAMSPSSAQGAADVQRPLLRKIRESLRENAHDETLSPAKLANLLGISKRYLHALFATAGTTFSKELMSIRLERAQRQLADPQFGRVSICEIAMRCGFNDASHFTRRFNQRYGASPSEYRRSILPPALAEDSSD